jgi:hypothetical protein
MNSFGLPVVLAVGCLAGCAMEREATLRVIDAQSGQPVPGAEVTPRRATTQPHIPFAYPVTIRFPSEPVLTDADGNATVTVGWRDRVRVASPNHWEAEVESLWPWPRATELATNESVPLEFENGIVTIPLSRRDWPLPFSPIDAGEN